MKSHLMIILTFYAFFSGSLAGAAVPDWTVNPASYQFSANITAVVYINDAISTNDTNRVGAFIGGELRGVASPVVVAGLDMFFLTVYSNSSGATVNFKIYDAESDQIVDIDESLIFVPNGIYGDPVTPVEWHAYFNFDYPPVVAGIPDQTIEEGQSFSPVNLDGYLTQNDSDPVVWSHNSPVHLTVVIDGNNVATVTPNSPTWIGSENVVFTATEQTANARADTDTALFTVYELDHPPQLLDIPDMVIGTGGSLPPIDLNAYFTEFDGDIPEWTFDYQAVNRGQPIPNWSVNPPAFAFQMGVTAQVTSHGDIRSGDSHYLAAFCGDDVRGVTQAVEYNGAWLYFLQVHANTNGEDVSFYFYDAVTQEVLAVAETFEFSANTTIGTPGEPTNLTAGNLLLSVDANHILTVEIINPDWTGSETYSFILTDSNTYSHLSDSDWVTFTTIAAEAPVIQEIGDQMIEIGDSFDNVNLDNYLANPAIGVVWSAAGQVNLEVVIDPLTSEAVITPHNPAWTGSETITFVATSDPPNGLFDTESVTFTVVPQDDLPVIFDIPNQSIGAAGTFAPIDLSQYFAVSDGNSVAWRYEFVVTPQSGSPPAWSVNPPAFQFSMALTAVVHSREKAAIGATHQLAAFVDGDLRGVSDALYYNGQWVYFLTIYGNTGGETVRFEFYDALANEVLPVYQTILFQPNQVIGNPLNPYLLEATHLRLSLVDDVVSIAVLNPEWSGSETVNFTVQDVGTLNEYAVSDPATFSVDSDHAPLVDGIGDQTIEEGQAFAAFNLNDYLTELDGHSVDWGFSGDQNVTVQVDAGGTVTVVPDPGWIGSNSLIFTATDITANAYSDPDTAVFAVIPQDHAPVVADIPDQSVEQGQNFSPVNLSAFLTETDGHEVVWSYAFPAEHPTQPDPAWAFYPNQYQFSMNITGRVMSNGQTAAGTTHRLAAFSGEEVRGVAQAIDFAGSWLYFLTIYSNANGEPITFKFYDGERQLTYPVAEVYTFGANDSHGTPLMPDNLTAGFLQVTIDAANQAVVQVVADDWQGSETVRFIATDQNTPNLYSTYDEAIFSVIAANAVNDPPVAADDAYSVNEDNTLTVNVDRGVVTNDNDVENDPLSATVLDDVDHGVLALNPDGSFVYTPAADYTGTDTFTYTVNDGEFDSNVATVILTVNPINDAPVAQNDAYSMDEDQVLTVNAAAGVLANDADVETDPLTATKLSNPSSGTLVFNTDGSFTYTPMENNFGTVSFQYRATDGLANSQMAEVTITINSVNDAPLAFDDEYSLTEDVPLHINAAAGVLADDSDVEGTTLTAVVVTTAAHGTLTLNADGSFDYEPELNYNGTDTFTYRASDGQDSSNLAAVTLTISGVNDAPGVANDGYSINEDSFLNVTSDNGVLDNDFDPENYPMTASLVSNTAHGALNFNSDGSFDYTPNPNYHGNDNFTYEVSDGSLTSAVATVTISVVAVNDIPVAVADSYTTAEDTPLTRNALTGVLSNDTDADNQTLTAILVQNAAHGSLTLNTNGSFNYTPAPDYHGPDTFSYQANDGTANSAMVTVNLTVTPVNDAPVANADYYSVDEDLTLTRSAANGVLTNDTDADLQTLTAELLTWPSHGQVTFNSDGSFSYVPAQNYNGPDTFSYRSGDGVVFSAPATVTLTINPVNDAPVANGANVNTLEDTSKNILLSASDVDQDNLTYTIVSDPTHGTLFGTPPNLTYYPDPNYNGSDSFTFTAHDGYSRGYESGDQANAISNLATINIAISPVNDEPTALGQSVATPEDTPLAINLLGNDVDNDPLTYSIINPPAHGALSGNAPNLVYTPAANYFGPDTFTFRVYDGNINSQQAVVSIDVTSVNDPPQADNQTLSTEEDVPVSLTLTGSDVDSPSLTFTISGSPANGTVTGVPPQVTYNPNPGWFGMDQFQFIVNDGAVNSLPGTITINVNERENTPPEAQTQTLVLDEDTDLNLTLGGTDADNDVLTFEIITGPQHGTISGTMPDLTYTPGPDYHGADALQYHVFDGTVYSNPATITLTINPVNDAPAAAALDLTTPEDAALVLVLAGSDVDNDPLTYLVVTPPSQGTLTGSAPNLTYTPPLNFFGAATFTYQVNDGITDSDIAAVTITVSSVNDAPTAANQNVSGPEDTNQAIILVGSDPENDPLSYTVTVNPTHGTLSGTAPNLVYTPSANYYGPDNLTFVVNDGSLNSNPATIMITITPVNDPPIADNLSAGTPEDTPVMLGLTGFDADNDNLTFALATPPQHGALSGTPPQMTYTPAPNYFGSDAFTFTVHDGTESSPAGTVSLTITPVNDAPLVTAAELTTAEDTPLSYQLTGTDPENDALTFLIVDQPDHGTISGILPDIVYTPALNYFGDDSFSYRANDGTDDSNLATIAVVVEPANDAPVAVDKSFSTNEDVNKSVLLSASDVENESLAFSVVSDPGHGTLSGTAPNLIYQPAANYNGPDSFTFQANDGTDDSNIATVTITVNPVNDAPVAMPQSVTTEEDTPVGIVLSGTDVENTPLSYALASPPAHGDLTGTPPSLTYTPDPDYSGSDSFTFAVNDGQLTSNPATVSISINSAGNTVPVAASQVAVTNEDTALPILLSGSDGDNDPLSFEIVDGPQHGSLLGAPPSVSYLPDDDYFGPDSFTFLVNDGIANSPLATVSITVNPINDAPVADDKTILMNEDATRQITLTAVDVENNTLTYAVSDEPLHGALSGMAPNLSYTPALNYNGPDFFTYVANDGQANSNLATVTITVTAVNDAPVAAGQSTSTAEDTPLSITLAAVDAENSPLTYSIVTPPGQGVLSGTAPNLTYSPDTNYFGTDSFVFRVNDGTANSNNATISITINPVNDPPVAQDQSLTMAEDMSLNLVLAATDVENSPLTYTLVTQPQHGSITGTPPNVTYSPGGNYNGSDSFTFTAGDGTDQSAPATVNLTITAVNDAPVALAQSISTNEDTGQSFYLSVTDVDNDALTYSIVTQPQHGTLSGTLPNVTYSPAANYYGSDSFTFKGHDGTVSSNTAVVSITINPVNDAPVALGQNLTTAEDTPLPVLLSGTDVENNPLTYSIVNPPQHGTLNGTAPSLTFTPAANYHGPDSFTFRVNDGTLNSTTAFVSITITPVNDAPVAVSQTVTTNEDGTLNLLLNVTDVENNPITYAIVSPPLHGTLSGTLPDITYRPAANYYGSDSFTFKGHDGSVSSNTATITITINAVNDAPIAQTQERTTPEDTALTLSLGGSDGENDPLTFTIVDQPLQGTLTGQPPAVIYTPAANFNGPDLFTFKANDGLLDSAPATIFITVDPVNDPPQAVDQALTTPEDTALSLTLIAADIESDPLTFEIVGQPLHGNLSGIIPDLTYTPDLNYAGPDELTFTAGDGTEISPIATVSLTIEPVNDAPLAASQSVTTQEDTPVDIELIGSDAENNPLIFTIETQPAHGSLSGVPPQVTYTPNPDYSGTDSFTFTINDGALTGNTATVSISINPAGNTLPVASDQSLNTLEDTALAVTLSGSDDDGDNLTYQLVTQPVHGILTGTAPSLIYTPDDNYYGSDSFTFLVNDGQASSQPATISINVTAVNDVPVVSDQFVTMNEDATRLITLTGVDTENTPLVFSVVAAPQHGNLGGNPPNLSYTPAANYFGADSFTFIANDGTDDSSPATVHITVNPVNDPPVAAGQTQVTAEDTSLPLHLLVTDSDNEPLTYSIVTPPAHGILGGTLPNPTYFPTANFFGTDSFTFKAHDGTASSNTAIVTITVNAVNDAPTAPSTYLTTAEDTDLAITLPAADPENDPLTYSLVDLPENGVLSGTPPEMSYWPNANYFGSDSFTFIVNDGLLDSPLSRISITVTAVNDPPLAADQSLTTGEDTPLNIALTVTDIDNAVLTYVIVTPPQFGTLSGTPPAMIYTPVPDYYGPDSFTFKGHDGTVNSNTATVSIAVTPVNDAPVASPQHLTTDENMPIAITLTGSDAENDPLTFAISTPPAHGTLLGAAPYLTYSPDTGYFGPDSFTFTGNDGLLSSPPAVVNISINPAGNNAPEAISQSYNMDEDGTLSVTLTGSDDDDDALTFQVVNHPAQGNLSGNPPNLIYTPAANFFGADGFTFIVNDGTTNSNPGAVTISINPVNDPPVAAELSINLEEDQSANFSLHVTDVDNSQITYSIADQPQHGTLGGSLPEVTYIPDENYFGADFFTYTGHDGLLSSNPATVSLTLAAVNDAPVALAQTVATAENMAVAIDLSGTDAEDDALTFVIVTPPAHGVLSGVPPHVTYTPNPDYSGTDSFTFITNDGQLTGSPATVSIIINPAGNTPPVAISQTLNTNEDSALPIILTGSDDDNDNLSFQIISPPVHGQLTGVLPNMIYTPDPDYYGPDSFTFRVNDGAVNSSPAVISITVEPVNDPPEFNPVDPFAFYWGDTYVIPLGDIFADDDDWSDLNWTTSGNTHVTVNIDPENGVIRIFVDGTDWFGSEAITISVTDSGGLSANLEITVTVQVESGDLNADGEISLLDIDLISEAILGHITLSAGQVLAGDSNGDGVINILDLNHLVTLQHQAQ